MLKLHEYQERCAAFICGHNNCILSVDMGLGKTAATLFAIAKIQPETLLVVAPKRVAENNWHTEAEKWGLDWVAERMVVVRGTRKQRAVALYDNTRPYKIISRDNLRDVEGYACDMLVLDELTSFKSVDSARSRYVQSINAPRKVGLTGTFLANGAIDIFGQAAAVGLHFGSFNFYAWRAVHFRDALKGSGLAFSKWQPASTIEEILAPIAPDIFTLSAEDYLEIPPVTFTTHAVALSQTERKAYEDCNAFMQFDMGDGLLSVDEGAKFMKLQTLCNGFVYNADGVTVRGGQSSKLQAVADFVEQCRDAGEPVLLFYAFRGEAMWLHEMLTARGIKCESVQSRGFLERWNNRETECLFAHPASAGHGLNMQHGGRVVVWSSLTYNYELYAQGNARLARQGQTGNVQIHIFAAENTVEQRVSAALAKKSEEQQQFITLTKQ